jgi:hypothetical protein
MSYLGTKDFLLEVAKGKVAGHSLVHKFGRNDAVPNGSFEKISLLSIPTAFLSATTTVRVKAGGDANDTSGGSGARKVTVQGIQDTLLTEASEEITLAGASASSATTVSFWRINRAWVSEAGTYGGANTAAVTLENSGGGTDLLLIGAGEGQTQYGGYTIPTGQTGYLMSITTTVDALKAADIRMYTREDFTTTSAPVSSKRVKRYWDGVLGGFHFEFKAPMLLPAETDIWFEAQGAGAITEASVDFEILLVAD